MESLMMTSQMVQSSASRKPYLFIITPIVIESENLTSHSTILDDGDVEFVPPTYTQSQPAPGHATSYVLCLTSRGFL